MEPVSQSFFLCDSLPHLRHRPSDIHFLLKEAMDGDGDAPGFRKVPRSEPGRAPPRAPTLPGVGRPPLLPGAEPLGLGSFAGLPLPPPPPRPWKPRPRSLTPGPRPRSTRSPPDLRRFWTVDQASALRVFSSLPPPPSCPPLADMVSALVGVSLIGLSRKGEKEHC